MIKIYKKILIVFVQNFITIATILAVEFNAQRINIHPFKTNNIYVVNNTDQMQNIDIVFEEKNKTTQRTSISLAKHEKKHISTNEKNPANQIKYLSTESAVYMSIAYESKNAAYAIHLNSQDIKHNFSYLPPIGDFDNSLEKPSKWFDYAMNLDNPFVKGVMLPLRPDDLYNFLKNTYKTNHFSNLKASIQPKIPKRIHQIWLGGKFPDKYVKIQESWRNNHPNWEYFLWTDNSINYRNGSTVITNENEFQRYLSRKPICNEITIVDVRGFKLINQQLFEQTANWGAKADILRYEILYNYGGLYIDTDFECLQPFDFLHYFYDFYAGIAPLNVTKLQVANGLIGSKPQHPILIECIKNMTNPDKHQEIGKIMWHGTSVVAATGPAPFTKAIFKQANKNNTTDIIFPPTYFYPLRAEYLNLKKSGKLKNMFFYQFEALPLNFKAPIEALAHHYWDEAWA